MSFLTLDLKTEYRSLHDDVVKNFYVPVLRQAIKYKRAVGFFSSSSLLELSEGICGLVDNGGTIDLIASPKLSQEDIEAINEGLRHQDDVFLEALFRELKEPQGTVEQRRLNLLSNLVAAGRLSIKIAYFEGKNTIGMFHEKVGLMFDNDNHILAFSGSMNESSNAFYQNYESIDVFSSWTMDSARVANKLEAFNTLWFDDDPDIRVVSFEKLDEEIIRRYRTSDTIDTFDEIVINEATSFHEEKKPEPHIPDNIELRPYQKQAIDNWLANNGKGIFDMATGTGKTITALAAACRLYENEKRLAIIIVCPFQHLVEQWKEDILLFGLKPIVCYSSSAQKNWKERLHNAIASYNLRIISHFCVVTTNATFAIDYVQSEIAKLHNQTLLIVDEAHNFGANKLRLSLPDNIPFRLALSATIERNNDINGTEALICYFGSKCIEYSIKDAIDNKMLVPYFYHPVIVNLTGRELEEYLELTEKIGKNLRYDKHGKAIISDYIKILLIQRSRIVAGAANKIDVLREYIKQYKDDNHILVYCGSATILDGTDQDEIDHENTIRQIDAVSSLLGNELGMRISQFTASEARDERERIREDFAAGKHLQALVAIKCLDEGVNIPSIRTAFILASSTNPKEYIQRRGRVLRNSPGKTTACIYDFVTLPFQLNETDQFSPDVIASVRSMIIREIARIIEFSSISENPYESDSLLYELTERFDIDLNEIKNMEEDDYYV